MNPSQIITDLRNLGILETDTILVHSSHNALKGNGQIEGGPAAVISALKHTVSRGTLMLPTLSWEAASPAHPYFNVNTSVSCVGILPEIMRTSEGIFRSPHPTHSVAIWGQDAEAIAAAHLRDHTPVGPNSPFAELRRRNGKIIMLGCGLESNTTMHGVEEMVAPPYVYGSSNDYTLTLACGNVVKQPYLNHGFGEHVHQRYERILPLLSTGEVWQGKVLCADCTVYSAPAVWEKGVSKLREDMYYFVDIEEKEVHPSNQVRSVQSTFLGHRNNGEHPQ